MINKVTIHVDTDKLNDDKLNELLSNVKQMLTRTDPLNGLNSVCMPTVGRAKLKMDTNDWV